MAENNMGIEKGQTTIKEPEIKPATPRKAAEYKGPWTPPPIPADKRNFLQKRWKQLVFTTAGLLGLAGSIYGIAKINEPEPIPITSTFDAQARDAYITSYNSVQMTFDEYEKVAPTLWQTEDKTLTIPLPIKFRDNRTPALHIAKSESMFSSTLINAITIDGLEEGDIILSPVNGKINKYKGDDDLSNFVIHATDSQGRDLVVSFTTNGINPIFDFSVSEIKKGDLIGMLTTSDQIPGLGGQIQIRGNGPLLENFNLGATPDGEAIMLRY